MPGGPQIKTGRMGATLRRKSMSSLGIRDLAASMGAFEYKYSSSRLFVKNYVFYFFSLHQLISLRLSLPLSIIGSSSTYSNRQF
jgi:hypothetical protein